jgi:hypothetical protein
VTSVDDIIHLECAEGPNLGHEPASSVICEIVEGPTGEIPM